MRLMHYFPLFQHASIITQTDSGTLMHLMFCALSVVSILAFFFAVPIFHFVTADVLFFLGVKNAKTAATTSSTGTSPKRCPLCSGYTNAWTAMIPPCTMLDHSEPDKAEMVERILGRDYQEDAERRIDPDDHLQIERMALHVPGPSQRPVNNYGTLIPSILCLSRINVPYDVPTF